MKVCLPASAECVVARQLLITTMGPSPATHAGNWAPDVAPVLHFETISQVQTEVQTHICVKMPVFGLTKKLNDIFPHHQIVDDLKTHNFYFLITNHPVIR